MHIQICQTLVDHLSYFIGKETDLEELNHSLKIMAN